MATITITLTDTESGHVKIDCDPDMAKLLEIAKSGKYTAAEAYAMSAIRKLIEDSFKAAGVEGTPRFKLQ